MCRSRLLSVMDCSDLLAPAASSAGRHLVDEKSRTRLHRPLSDDGIRGPLSVRRMAMQTIKRDWQTDRVKPPTRSCKSGHFDIARAVRLTSRTCMYSEVQETARADTKQATANQNVQTDIMPGLKLHLHRCCRLGRQTLRLLDLEACGQSHLQ